MKNTKQTPAGTTVRDRAGRALDKAALASTTGAAACTACGHLSSLESDLASELR